MAGVLPGSRGLDVPRGARGAARSRPRGGRGARGRAPRRSAAPPGDPGPGGRARSVTAPRDAPPLPGPSCIRRPRRHRAGSRDGVDRVPDGLVWAFRLRQDAQLHDGTPLGPDEVVATLAERISADEPPDGAPAWVRPFRGAARIVREVRRGEGSLDPDRRRAAVRAAPRAPGAPGPRDRCAAGRPASRGERALPGGRAHPGAAGWKRPRLAGRGAPERPPDPARGRRRREPRSPGFARRPPPRRAAGRAPSWAAVGLQVVSGPTWRIGLLALRADRGLTSRKTVRQAVALALDPRFSVPPWASGREPHAAWLPPGAWAVRDAGPLVFDPARERAACWRRSRR